MLLDTSFLIELERELASVRVGSARSFLGGHRSQPVLISVASVCELAAGMQDSATARSFFRRGGFRIVNVFFDLALRAAELDRALMAAGARIGEMDTIIAGTALYYGQPLVTNDSDFDRVTGLRVLHY
ncbi:MAG TPA: type II toxin-antitoxin system VapC family toxin [Verrucomicrobiae bacterium]|nr:type II toxin-antitoxin system VapC family toxin [Verrucomicrobiae bacterium]